MIRSEHEKDGGLSPDGWQDKFDMIYRKFDFSTYVFQVLDTMLSTTTVYV